MLEWSGIQIVPACTSTSQMFEKSIYTLCMMYSYFKGNICLYYGLLLFNTNDSLMVYGFDYSLVDLIK